MSASRKFESAPLRSGYEGSALSSVLALSLLIVQFGLASCSNEGSTSGDFGSEPLDVKLAYWDGVVGDEIKIARYRSLLSQLTDLYVDPPQGIYETIYATQSVLKKKGIEESALNIMVALNQAFPVKVPNQRIDPIAGAYITLRDRGMSNEQAMSALSTVASSTTRQ